MANDKGKQYLVKFNRSQDSFDMAAVEWSCLQVAAAAGLRVAKASLDTIGTRSCLKIKRFDISPEGGRYHLLTCNALLKDRHTQDDAHQGRYEDIADLIRLYCINPIDDLEQLFGQLLINQALHNTDDHLRNFSFLHDGRGWQLSPVYDIVLDETMGSHHQLTLDGKPFLPSLDKAEITGKALGLGKAASRRVAEKVAYALRQWPGFLTQAKLKKSEYKCLMALID